MEGTKLKSVPFRQWQLKTIFGDYFFSGPPLATNMKRTDLFLELSPRYELNLVVKLTNAELRKNIWSETTISKNIKFFGVIILITRYEFTSWRDMNLPSCHGKYRLEKAKV